MEAGASRGSRDAGRCLAR